MDKNASLDKLEKLFKAPQTFKRERYEEFLYAPYSPKAHRRIYCYGHDTYNLWAILESDYSIIRLNDGAMDTSVSIDHGTVAIKPNFVTKNEDGSIIIHVIAKDSASACQVSGELPVDIIDCSKWTIDPLTKWAEDLGISIKVWQRSHILTNPVRLRNIKQLLRFICNPKHIETKDAENLVLSVLRTRRICTIDHVLQNLNEVDPNKLLPTLASMILNGLCYSDIHLYPFHYATELSLFHEFE